MTHAVEPARPGSRHPISLRHLLSLAGAGSGSRSLKGSLEKSRRFNKPIVTQIVPAATFYEAEDYHQQYLEKRGLATCHIK